MKRCVLVVVLGLAGALTVHATQVRLLNLIDMVALADRVFVGVCVRAEVMPEEAWGLTAIQYTFRVHHAMKGVGDGDLVTFRQVAYLGNTKIPMPGMPAYKKGHELLLFLHGDSSLGLTSPVGLGQGLFRLQRLSDGRLGVTNFLANGNLFHDVDLAAMEAIGVDPAVLTGGEGGVIALDDFAVLVTGIRDNQQLLHRGANR